MVTRVLIVGDGDAGTIMANKLRFHTDRRDVDITVVGNSKDHYFKPDGVHISFNMIDYKKSVKPTEFLFNYGVNYIRDTVSRIDVADHTVQTTGGRNLDYDYLVIATGDRFTPEDVPGYAESAKHFYDLPHALELQKEIKGFKGGKIVIGQASIPIMCPPAPYEFTFLLEEYLNFHGLKDKTEIHYIYPLNRVFTIPNVADFVGKRMEERGIITHTLFNVDSIDPKNKKIQSLEGESINYDLLVLIPPHRGQKVITDSGLADESGYIDVDKYKLNYKDYDNVFAIGDATNLPVSKAGATAHFEALYLSNRIAAETSGNVYNELYEGDVACTTVTGYEKGLTLYFNYGKPPRANYDSKLDYFLKWQSGDTFFSSMLRGVA